MGGGPQRHTKVDEDMEEDEILEGELAGADRGLDSQGQQSAKVESNANTTVENEVETQAKKNGKGAKKSAKNGPTPVNHMSASTKSAKQSNLADWVGGSAASKKLVG